VKKKRIEIDHFFVTDKRLSKFGALISKNQNTMTTFKKIVAAGCAAVMLASCSITLPVNATSNPVGTKVGKSSGNCFLGALCFGVDASIQTAAKNGGISKISTVDYQNKNILNLIITHTCIVTGE
jgi:hypothetical protein